MEIAEPFFVLNPAIGGGYKKYIWGIDKKAKCVFKELCTRRRYIDGFIDEKNVGMLCFHKPVYGMEELNLNKENSVLLLPNGEKGPIGYKTCAEICILNPKLQGKEVIIYGAGIVGEKALSILQDQDIKVEGFIDSDESKVGTFLLGKKIYGKNILQTLSDGTVIVECGRRYYEIDDIVKSMRDDLTRIYLDDEMPFESDDIWVDKKQNRKIGIWPIAQLGEYCSHEQIKEIILYGNDLSLAGKYAEVFKCLDFGPVSYMTDQSDDNTTTLIEEIIYKENYLLLWYEEERDAIIAKMTELGVERLYYSKMISELEWYPPSTNASTACLDVNLGYTYETNCEYPGIYVYGENRTDDYKIAVLGGSTTDSMCDLRICSWVEILYKKYCNNQITIFNGGVSGYSSAQELFKLIRDMLKLCPDMVIVYDGFNDIVKQERSAFWYLESLVHYAGKHMPVPWQMHFGEKAVWRGIPSAESSINRWLKNINNMYALSKSNNIDFFAFMQPMLYTKKNLDVHSRTLLSATPLFHNARFMEDAWRFRKRAKEICEQHNYIYDLTYIFDNDDVYMDACHVYESGNYIIAQSIWNVVKSSIEQN